MPGARDKMVTRGITRVQRLQEEISAWATELSGTELGSDFEELLLHLTGAGHFEIFKLAFLAREDSSSEKARFERDVTALNMTLVRLHAAHQRRILMMESLVAQLDGTRAYGKAAQRAVDQFMEKWKLDTLPAKVLKAYVNAGYPV